MDGGMKEDLAIIFGQLEDPRIDRHKKYPLCEIVFLVLYSAILGVESWRGIELIGHERINFLRNFFEFSNGIPSHQTIGRVFSILKPKSFEGFFIKWTSIIYGENQGKQIAIDGKTVRGSGDKANGIEAIHLLNACAVDCGVTLGQMEVGAKTNEIKLVPEMLDALEIKGSMISVDALNTQKDIAQKIIKGGADYTLALKGNHKILNNKVENLFLSSELSAVNHWEEFEKLHGRETHRIYDVLSVDKYNLDETLDWKGLKGVGMVQTKNLKSEKPAEIRYYLLSYRDVNLFAKSARGHWGVESLHWSLDVTFNEDASTKRKDFAPRNYSLIRKFALNIMRPLKGKLTIPLVKIKAAMKPEYLEKLLTDSGFKKLLAREF